MNMINTSICIKQRIYLLRICNGPLNNANITLEPSKPFFSHRDSTLLDMQPHDQSPNGVGRKYRLLFVFQFICYGL